MVGYVCTVASGKGGVGKTTTAANLGRAFASAGRVTVVVDADLGMADLAGVVGVDVEHSVHGVLAGEASVTDALTPAVDGMTVVPGARDLTAYAEADPANLRHVIETLRTTHEVVIVDTGSGLSHETAVPLGLADGVLLVTTPDEVAIEDTKKTAKLAEKVDGEVVGGLATQVRRETQLEGIESRLGYPVIGVVPSGNRAGEEPILEAPGDSDRSEAFEQVVDVLDPLFFQDADLADADPVYKSAWLDGEDTDDEERGDDDTGDTDSNDNDDDDGGYTPAIFQRI